MTLSDRVETRMTTENITGGRTVSGERTATPRRGRLIGFAFLGLWAVSITIPLGLFSAAHMAVLPVAKESVSGQAEMSGSGWGIVHVLSEDCSCSRSVLEYLLERKSKVQMAEEVVLLDASDGSLDLLRAAGFLVSTAESENFCSAYGSEGVPFFQVLTPEDETAYSGAYFDSAYRGTSGFLDLETLDRLKAGGLVFDRPVFGCATSDRLKSILDPFGFKRATLF